MKWCDIDYLFRSQYHAVRTAEVSLNLSNINQDTQTTSYGSRVNPTIVHLPLSLLVCEQYDLMGQMITVYVK